MGINLNPISGIIDSAANAITGVGGMIFGNKEQRDQQSSTELLAAQAGYQSEFAAPEKKSIFGQFVDGINRLVRPFFTFGTVALFIWCVVDPSQFAISMQALQLMPANLWYILFAIVTFWFGSRLYLDKATVSNAPANPTQVRQVLNNQAMIAAASEKQKLDKFIGSTKGIEPPLGNNPVIESWSQKFKAGE